MLDQQLFFIVLFFHSFKTSKRHHQCTCLLEPLVRGSNEAGLWEPETPVDTAVQREYFNNDYIL